jgi:hypothetical protein
MREYIINPRKPKMYIEFKMYAEEKFKLNYVSQRLGISATSVLTDKGFKPYTPEESIIDTSWYFETEEFVTYNFDEEFKKIMYLLHPKIDELMVLKKELDLHFTFCVVINMYNQCPPSIYLDNESIRFLNEIGATIDFDIYCFDLPDDAYGNAEDD